MNINWVLLIVGGIFESFLPSTWAKCSKARGGSSGSGSSPSSSASREHVPLYRSMGAPSHTYRYGLRRMGRYRRRGNGDSESYSLSRYLLAHVLHYNADYFHYWPATGREQDVTWLLGVNLATINLNTARICGHEWLLGINLGLDQSVLNAATVAASPRFCLPSSCRHRSLLPAYGAR